MLREREPKLCTKNEQKKDERYDTKNGNGQSSDMTRGGDEVCCVLKSSTYIANNVVLCRNSRRQAATVRWWPSTKTRH